SMRDAFTTIGIMPLRMRYFRVAACVIFVLLTLAIAAAQFVDPSPPAVSKQSSQAAPQATAQPELTFHNPPKVLSKDAKVHDWPCFLGRTHNAISTETHLLKIFGKSGPPMVWEVKRGSGYSAPAISNGRLVVIHRVGDEEVVECLDAEGGKRFWRF